MILREFLADGFRKIIIRRQIFFYDGFFLEVFFQQITFDFAEH